MKLPRILLGAGASGSGKTLLTCGLLQVLVNRGLKTASFKCGPDYIDPMFHSRVIGTKSRNLDTFFTSEEVTRYLLSRNGTGMDIAVMEGVMGYYDGVGGTTSRASAYDLASVTETPAVFIVNCRGMSTSIVPYIKGFLEYKSPSWIQGVILNQMSPMLYPRVKEMIESQLPLKVCGYVPKLADCFLDSRHLGLVMPDEVPSLRRMLQQLAKTLEETLEMETILELARSAGDLECPESLEAGNPAFGYRVQEPVSLAVAMDEAFCFLYEDNLQLLRDMGAKLLPFSPLHDREIPPNADGVLLCGGYPELHLKELEANVSMRWSVHKSISQGMPCLAECGGFMYLQEFIRDEKEKEYQMTGLLPGGSRTMKKLTRFGYVTLTQLKKEVLGEDLGDIPAHEFHYFDSDFCGEVFLARKPKSSRSWKCMFGTEGILAGYPHLYYYGNPKVPRAFLEQCLEYRRKKL